MYTRPKGYVNDAVIVGGIVVVVVGCGVVVGDGVVDIIFTCIGGVAVVANVAVVVAAGVVVVITVDVGAIVDGVDGVVVRNGVCCSCGRWHCRY